MLGLLREGGPEVRPSQELSADPNPAPVRGVSIAVPQDLMEGEASDLHHHEVPTEALQPDLNQGLLKWEVMVPRQLVDPPKRRFDAPHELLLASLVAKAELTVGHTVVLAPQSGLRCEWSEHNGLDKLMI